MGESDKMHYVFILITQLILALLFRMSSTEVKSQYHYQILYELPKYTEIITKRL
jgi:hypothetical protein